jgi:hypothetical protein
LKGKFWKRHHLGKIPEEDKNNIACENEKAAERKKKRIIYCVVFPRSVDGCWWK